MEDTSSRSDFSGESSVLIEPRLRELVEVARPTPEFVTLLEELPEVFVGRPAQLETLVGVVAVALQASFTQRGLPLPPWRTKEAILENWQLSMTVDGLYRGGASAMTAPAAAPPAGGGGGKGAVPETAGNNKQDTTGSSKADAAVTSFGGQQQAAAGREKQMIVQRVFIPFGHPRRG